jgi:hypothetical protein
LPLPAWDVVHLERRFEASVRQRDLRTFP